MYNSAFLSNTSTGNGGGIEVMDMASLRLVDSRLVRNSAKSKGGGVMGDGATRIEVTGSRFTHNHAGNLPAFSGFGGGLGVGNGTGLVVTDSEFFTNSTEGGAGGGIDIYDAPYYTLTAITVMHNEANQGGGLDTFNSSGLLTGSQIISNVAKTGRGGGLLATEGNLTVVSSVFAQNRSDTTLGGGARIGNDMEALFLNTHFVENQATTGSGLCVCGDNITAVMRHCNFRENVGMTEEGAALTINEGKTTVVVMDSRLRENTGGAIWVGNQSRATIANNVVVNNPPHSGIVGQVRLRSSVAMTFTHNTVVGDKTNDGVRLLDNGVNVIANNIVVGQRNGIHFSPPATATLRNNLLWDNTTDYVDTAAGAGDVYSVPGFVDPAGYDYHLGVCSAAVDAAGSTAPVERDYDLDLRPVDGDNDATATADIGADERLTQTGKLPAAAFTYTVDGPDVAFTNASSYASAYQWDFGVAGATSVLTNPTYSYGGIGVYTVTLSATGDFGCVDQVQTAVAVVNVERHLLLPQLTVAPD